MQKKNKLVLYFLPLVIITILVLLHFSPALSNGISLDDTYYYDQIEDVHQLIDIPHAVRKNFSYVDYRPVSTFTFALQKVLSGDMINPHTSHAVNLILYIINCWLLYLFILKIPLAFRGKYVPIIATVLFLSLPLHNSMISNVKSRDGLLSFMFGMIYLILLLRIITQNEQIWKKALVFLVAVLALILAIYSKLDSFTFLMMTPVIFVLFYKKFNFKLILRTIIVLLVSYRLFFALFDWWSQSKKQAINYTEGEIYNDPVLFTENPIAHYDDLSHKLGFAVQTVFEYVKLTFEPTGHYFYFGYDMLPVLPITDSTVWLKLLIMLLMASTVLVFFNKNKLYGFGVSLFFIGLIYCSNLITPVSGIIADRYGYIASAGACIAIASILSYLWEIVSEKYLSKWYVNKKNIQSVIGDKKSLHVLIFIIILTSIYVPFNRVRAHEWDNYFSIFDADLPHIGTRSYEANRIAFKNYVETAMNTQDPNESRILFQKGFNSCKEAIGVYDKDMEAYDGIIYSLYGLGREEEGLKFARRVISKFDTTEIGWSFLTQYYESQGMSDSVEMGYKKLTEISPKEDEIKLFYVSTLRKNNKLPEAITYLDSIEKAQPTSYFPYRAKFHLYIEAGDSLKAVLNLEKGMSMGWRDNDALNVAGQYWWNKNSEKYESLKRFVQ
ncbi:MAG: hypothetical protein M9887_08335 [Chitinophagales bacterium]|nr:hypothetical protein [Chitinophagales bacterium]